MPGSRDGRCWSQRRMLATGGAVIPELRATADCNSAAQSARPPTGSSLRAARQRPYIGSEFEIRFKRCISKETHMVARSRRGGWYPRVGSLALIAAALLSAEAQATIILFSTAPGVTGGTFVNDEHFGTFADDRLSMSIFGDYSFTASATSATVTIDSLLLLPLNFQGPYNVNTSIDGSFASDLADTTARLTSYSASSFLFNFEGIPSAEVPVPGTTATASIASLPETLPTATPDFPLSALHLQASATTPTTIPADTFVQFLGQSTTIQFDGLTVGETIDINLPDDSSLTPGAVPEPQSLTLWGLGSLITFGAWTLRSRNAKEKSTKDRGRRRGLMLNRYGPARRAVPSLPEESHAWSLPAAKRRREGERAQ
jgi:hypothetical protein